MTDIYTVSLCGYKGVHAVPKSGSESGVAKIRLPKHPIAIGVRKNRIKHSRRTHPKDTSLWEKHHPSQSFAPKRDRCGRPGRRTLGDSDLARRHGQLTGSPHFMGGVWGSRGQGSFDGEGCFFRKALGLGAWFCGGRKGELESLRTTSVKRQKTMKDSKYVNNLENPNKICKKSSFASCGAALSTSGFPVPTHGAGIGIKRKLKRASKKHIP